MDRACSRYEDPNRHNNRLLRQRPPRERHQGHEQRMYSVRPRTGGHLETGTDEERHAARSTGPGETQTARCFNSHRTTTAGEAATSRTATGSDQ